MKKRSFLFGAIALFMGCMIVSCSKDTPAAPPTTIVRGVVTDGSTGKPVPNLQLQLQSQVFLEYSFDKNLKTNADGSFYIKYAPKGTNPKLFILPEPIEDYYVVSTQKGVTTGQDNNFNLQIFKLVNLTIHLKNNSTQNEKMFRMVINGNNYGRAFEFPYSPVIMDTLIYTKLIQVSPYNIQSTFYNGYTSAGYYTDSVVFKKTININTADTTVNIINP